MVPLFPAAFISNTVFAELSIILVNVAVKVEVAFIVLKPSVAEKVTFPVTGVVEKLFSLSLAIIKNLVPLSLSLVIVKFVLKSESGVVENVRLTSSESSAFISTVTAVPLTGTVYELAGSESQYGMLSKAFILYQVPPEPLMYKPLLLLTYA